MELASLDGFCEASGILRELTFQAVIDVSLAARFDSPHCYLCRIRVGLNLPHGNERVFVELSLGDQYESTPVGIVWLGALNTCLDSKGRKPTAGVLSG